MYKRFISVVMAVFLLLPVMVFADEKKDEQKIDTWLYFQPYWEWNSENQGFSISKSRTLITLDLPEEFSCFVEIEIVPTVQLIKAQLEYQFGDQKIIVGQQSNSFKFYNPPPHKRILVQYPLASLVPTFDDLGITWQGSIGSVLNYRLSVLNGKGRNYKDDNKDKDTVVLVKFSPLNWFSITGCWQGGYQEWTKDIEERHYRSGQWFQGEIKPFSKLVIKPTWVKRNDLEKEGWFILGLLQINAKDQLLVQYLKDVNKEDELTLGAILSPNKKVRFLPNVFFRKKLNDNYDIGIYLMTQINIDSN